MCRDCNICGQNPKVSAEESIKRGHVTFDGKKYIGNKGETVWPIARCHICGCSWISDVGDFEPPEEIRLR